MEGTDRRKVTLDDAENRRLAKSDPALFLEMHPAPVLINEVQYAPELFPISKSTSIMERLRVPIG